MHTHHSQQPPSHHMSNAPMAVYARSMVALPRTVNIEANHAQHGTYLPKLLIPWTIPPLPPLPPISAAMLMKLSTFRCMFPSGRSLRSLPHSQEKMQPLGAFDGMGGMGLRTR